MIANVHTVDRIFSQFIDWEKKWFSSSICPVNMVNAVQEDYKKIDTTHMMGPVLFVLLAGVACVILVYVCACKVFSLVICTYVTVRAWNRKQL